MSFGLTNPLVARGATNAASVVFDMIASVRANLSALVGIDREVHLHAPIQLKLFLFDHLGLVVGPLLAGRDEHAFDDPTLDHSLFCRRFRRP